MGGVRSVSQGGWWLTTCLILGQLILGATMRHQHAGLAIPDFPLAYGKVWPAMSPEAVAHYNQQRIEAAGENAITAFQIGLQMVHRLVAVAIVALVGTIAVWSWREGRGKNAVRFWAFSWLGLIVTQILLWGGDDLVEQSRGYRDGACSSRSHFPRFWGVADPGLVSLEIRGRTESGGRC